MTRPASAPPVLRLGLIGDNIAASRAPLLHRLAGRQVGIEVRYDRLVPRDLGRDFEAVFAACAPEGFRGVNVTHPYKERAARMATVADPSVRAMGAVNTVLFGPDGPAGFNTDHSGFIAAYRRARPRRRPGRVALIGAGGVGRAVAFALRALGAEEIRITDRDAGKAAALAEDLARASGGGAARVAADAAEAARGAAGLINCTPVGMVGHEGAPLDPAAMRGAQWAFDAVYTPVETAFLREAARRGLSTISGHELFFFQGVHAFALFAGRSVDEQALRAALRAAARAPA